MRLTAETLGEMAAVKDIPANDNEPALASGWYFDAIDRLAKNKSPLDLAVEASFLRK